MFNFKRKMNIKMMKEKSIFDEIANCKTAEGFFSYIDRLPNPDIILRKTGKGIGVLRTLESNYQVGTCIESRKAGTKSKDFKLMECNTVKNHFALYEDIFKNLDISKLIDDILDAPLYGYNPIEIVWEKDSGYIVPVKAVAKPQEWFYFNSDGEFFFKDRTQGGKRQIDLDGYKFLLPRNKATFLNPYGQAILSRCFWNVAFINGGMEFWVKFSEKLGMPWIFGKYDRSMTDPEKQDFLTALVSMVQDAVGLIPNDGSVEVMQTGTSGNSEIYKLLVEKCEQNISKSILGQTLTTDIGSTGSYAASQTHAGIRADIVDSDTKLVEETIKNLIRMINEINFGDEEVPVYVEDVPEDILMTAEKDTKVHALGVNFSQEYIERTYGYKKGDIEIVDNTGAGFNFADFPDGQSPDSAERNEGRQSRTNDSSEPEENQAADFPDGQSPDSEERNEGRQSRTNDSSEPEENQAAISDNLESLADLKELQNAINPALKSVIEFFNTTREAEDTMEKLADLYPQLNTDELEDVLTKVIFISSIMALNEVSADDK